MGKSTKLSLLLFLLSFTLFGKTIYVNINFSGTGTGAMSSPFKTISEAVSVSSAGDEIKIAAGDYIENLILPGNFGLKLSGGYSPADFSVRNTQTYRTNISGANTSPVISIEYTGGIGDYQYYEINGFRIQGGERGVYAVNQGNGGTAVLLIYDNIISGNGGLQGSNDYGGGVHISGIISKVINNEIKNNSCGKSGGISLQLANPEYSFLLEGNIIEGNTIYSDHGAGAGIQAYKGIVRNNIFENNSILNSWGWGGGLIIDGNRFTGFNDSIYIRLEGNTYSGNIAPSGGSGLFIDEGANVRLLNELIIKNRTTESFRDGAFYIDGPRGTSEARTEFENCTIADNTGADYSYGHAIFIEGESEVTGKNSIFSGNSSADNNNDFYTDEGSSLALSYCVYVSGNQGPGNFNISKSMVAADPGFADPGINDYALKSKSGRYSLLEGTWVTDNEDSPVLNTGNPASVYINEPFPNGNRVNPGHLGNTVYASKVQNISSGEIYQVGPSRTYKSLQEVAGLLNPGDVVQVDGDNTYPGGIEFQRPGTASEKIHIIGIRVNGKRPVIEGGYNSVAFITPWPYTGPEGGHHYIFEGFEITGAEFRGIFHQAKDLTIRDCYVHDCLAHGILGADQGSGSILIEYTEVARCGFETGRHQIYMATDEVNNPGSVFRLQHCYIHSGNGGNNVKTRAERNEIYYNHIEGAFYHELELIGPDSDADGDNPNLKREDSDIVGNVLVKKLTDADNNPDFYVLRIGGDGTGESRGRYRFLNNTVIAGSSAVFRMYDGLESVEMQNNVFFNPSGILTLARTADATWSAGSEKIYGKANWMNSNAEGIPNGVIESIFGPDPGLVSVNLGNYKPASHSALVNTGELPLVSPQGFEFPNPLIKAYKHPPANSVELPGTSEDRKYSDQPDIGAFELISEVSLSRENKIPVGFVLYQNYPNPFNPSTTIEFSLSKDSEVTLRIYNLLGQEITSLINQQMMAGNHKVKFNASTAVGGLATGVYFYKLQAEGLTAVKRFLLVK